MPMPRWVARVNKRIFNPIEIRRGERPVLIHVGRSSGRVYETPLDAHPVDGGYVFVLVYGPKSDWVQNILSSGRARIRLDAEERELRHPRLISGGQAKNLLEGSPALPPGILRIDDFLRMDLA